MERKYNKRQSFDVQFPLIRVLTTSEKEEKGSNYAYIIPIADRSYFPYKHEPFSRLNSIYTYINNCATVEYNDAYNL